jgi:murein DD-endopeptidase MepM/ murein hydrolase activator NlpD
VRLTVVDGAGRRQARNDAGDTYEVVDAGYPIYQIEMPPSSMALVADPAKVNAEESFLSGLYGRWQGERRWQGPFLRPVGDMPITSGFGERRSVNGGPANYWHEGTDFGAQAGEPVHCAADGVVAFAGPLYVRGNVAVVDHGWGVLTGYFHMSEVRAATGQAVSRGDVLGLVGATGYVTGPHLHFEVRVHNVNVEPLEWLDDPAYDRPDLASL